MLPAPVVVRSQGQQSGDEADDSIGGLRFVKRSMTTIVKNDEDANKKRRRKRTGPNPYG
jgi:hypothetical protein